MTTSHYAAMTERQLKARLDLARCVARSARNPEQRIADCKKIAAIEREIERRKGIGH